MGPARRLPGGIPLGLEEQIVAGGNYRASLLLPFLRTNVVLTDRRVVASSPDTIIGIIPTGSNTVVYPLNQIASCQIGNASNSVSIIVGVILGVLSAFLLSYYVSDSFLYSRHDEWVEGLITLFGGISPFLILIGVLLVLAGIHAGIKITSTGGGQNSLKIAPWERSSAQNFINALNKVLVERME